MAGFKNPFRRKRIPHPDGVAAYYTPGIVFDGGAEHLAYHNDRPHPLLAPFFGFIPQRQFGVKERQVVYQSNALPVMTLLPGVVSGALPNPGALLQNGQLPNSQNNTVVNNALFGAVQS